MSVYIPPFKNVRLIECRDYIALEPITAYREFFAYGKKKAKDVKVNPDDPNSEQFWDEPKNYIGWIPPFIPMPEN